MFSERIAVSGTLTTKPGVADPGREEDRALKRGLSSGKRAFVGYDCRHVYGFHWVAVKVSDWLGAKTGSVPVFGFPVLG
jgi:hypothetical protein